MSDILKPGDEVMHRDGFGTDPPRKAKVLQIEKLYGPLPEDGDIVAQIPWAELNKRTVVMLDNGKWAYGDQVDRLETAYPTLQINRTYEANDGRKYKIVGRADLSSKRNDFFRGECVSETRTRYFTDVGACIAYFRANEPIIEASRSIATDEIEKINKESRS